MIHITVRCGKHPTYKAIRPPRANCTECQIIWQAVERIRQLIHYHLSYNRDRTF